jgi:hypothetical protein
MIALTGCASTSSETTQLLVNNTVAAGEPEANLHCKLERKPGSNFKTKVCMTREQIEENRRMAQDSLHGQEQRNSRLNTGGGN